MFVRARLPVALSLVLILGLACAGIPGMDAGEATTDAVATDAAIPAEVAPEVVPEEPPAEEVAEPTEATDEATDEAAEPTEAAAPRPAPSSAPSSSPKPSPGAAPAPAAPEPAPASATTSVSVVGAIKSLVLIADGKRNTLPANLAPGRYGLEVWFNGMPKAIPIGGIDVPAGSAFVISCDPKTRICKPK